MTYGSSVELHAPFEDVVKDVHQALADHGFGVLTQIDVQSTMKAKLGADLEPYLILGACNPHLALRALEIDPSLGLLLPCNVVVRGTGESTTVDFIDPQSMVAVSANPSLQSVADEAGALLSAALADLAA